MGQDRVHLVHCRATYANQQPFTLTFILLHLFSCLFMDCMELVYGKPDKSQVHVHVQVHAGHEIEPGIELVTVLTVRFGLCHDEALL